MCCETTSEGFPTCQTRDPGMLQLGLDFGTQLLLLTSGHDLTHSVTHQDTALGQIQWEAKFYRLPTDEIWYQDTKSQNNILKSPKATTSFDFCIVLHGQCNLALKLGPHLMNSA